MSLDTLDSLDAAVKSDNKAPTGAPTGGAIQRELDARDPETVIAARRARWECVIPEGVSEQTRDKLESALDIAHYALGMAQSDLYLRYTAIQSEIADGQGLDPFDDVVATKAAHRMAAEIEKQALSANPFADAPVEVQQKFGVMQAVARSAGYSPQQVATMVVQCVVDCEGDKRSAVALLQKIVNDDLSKERGHWRDRSYDTITERYNGEAGSPEMEPYAANDQVSISTGERGSDAVGSPEMEPYAANDQLSISTGERDEDGEPVFRVSTKEELLEDVHDAEVTQREVDLRIKKLNLLAAATLNDTDYAVYRLLSDNAYLLPDKVVNREEPISDVLQQELGYQSQQGANAALRRVKGQLREHEGKQVSGSMLDKALARIDTPTEVVVAGVKDRIVHRSTVQKENAQREKGGAELG